MTNTAAARPQIDFDPLDQAWRFQDGPIYDRIRAAGGIVWSSLHGGFWATADLSLVKQVTGDKRFISGEGVRIPPSGLPPVFALEYDDPAHAVHRKVLAEAVGGRIVPSLEPMIRRRAHDLLALNEDGVIDLGEDYAFRLPLDVMFEVIGAPEYMKREVEEIAGAIFIYRTPLADGRDAGKRLKELLAEMIAQVTAKPRSDWLTAVVSRRCPHSESLSDVEVAGAVMALLVGGHHTTVRVASSLVAQIVSDPALQKRLRAEPTLIPSAANEAVRMFVPLGWFARTATEDVVVCGVQIKKGERVLSMYAGASRDPNAYAQPDTFVPDRPAQPLYVAYGWGEHRCAGMALAQLELKVAVEELFTQSRWLSLREPIERTASSEARHIVCALER